MNHGGSAKKEGGKALVCVDMSLLETIVFELVKEVPREKGLHGATLCAHPAIKEVLADSGLSVCALTEAGKLGKRFHVRRGNGPAMLPVFFKGPAPRDTAASAQASRPAASAQVPRAAVKAQAPRAAVKAQVPRAAVKAQASRDEPVMVQAPRAFSEMPLSQERNLTVGEVIVIVTEAIPVNGSVSQAKLMDPKGPLSGRLPGGFSLLEILKNCESDIGFYRDSRSGHQPYFYIKGQFEPPQPGVKAAKAGKAAKVCQFYMRGFCKHGNGCRDQHVEPDHEVEWGGSCGGGSGGSGVIEISREATFSAECTGGLSILLSQLRIGGVASQTQAPSLFSSTDKRVEELG